MSSPVLYDRPRLDFILCSDFTRLGRRDRHEAPRDKNPNKYILVIKIGAQVDPGPAQ